MSTSNLACRPKAARVDLFKPMCGMHVSSCVCLHANILHVLLTHFMCPTGTSHTPLHSLQSTRSQDIIAQLLPMPSKGQDVLCRHTIDRVHAQSLKVPNEQVKSRQHILLQSYDTNHPATNLVNIHCNFICMTSVIHAWHNRQHDDQLSKFLLFVQEGGTHEVGAEWFLEMLLKAGANKQSASQAWVDNHYSWVIWKLAAYEHSHPARLKGKLLTAEVVLDQLKYRCAWMLQLFYLMCASKISHLILCARRLLCQP